MRRRSVELSRQQAWHERRIVRGYFEDMGLCIGEIIMEESPPGRLSELEESSGVPHSSCLS